MTSSLFRSKVLRIFLKRIGNKQITYSFPGKYCGLKPDSTVQYSTINHGISAVGARKVKQECQTESRSIPCAVP